MNFEGFEQIADYAWLKKGRKYWNLWAGNPFCISNYKPSLEISKEQVVKEVRQGQAEEKQRFAEQFPDVEWDEEYSSAIEKPQEAKRYLSSEPVEIEDGFGSVWSVVCPTCKNESMEVVRPGKAQCRVCQ